MPCHPFVSFRAEPRSGKVEESSLSRWRALGRDAEDSSLTLGMTYRSHSPAAFLPLLMMRRLVLPALAIFAAVGSARAQATDSTATTGKSVLTGVYTDEQATRGDSEHQANCTACHGTEKYTGEAFAKAWLGRTAFDLFDQLKTTMPDDNPGGLSAQQYVDIVAYIFKINGLPSGAAPLPADPEAMRLIKIEKAPDKETALGPRPDAARRDGLRLSQLRPIFHPHDPHAPASPSAKR
jgi:mono/diheme cytochrome c family protein